MEGINPSGLCSVFQRYNLKAIHNKPGGKRKQNELVLSISKIQSESNSQQAEYEKYLLYSCAQYFKDTI